MPQMPLGHIEFGQDRDPYKKWDADRFDRPKAKDEGYLPAVPFNLSDKILEAVEKGKREQFSDDCKALCDMCADPSKWEAALWVEKDGGYYHKKKNSKVEILNWCDADLLFLDWAERHQGETRI